MAAAAANKGLCHAKPHGCAPIGLQHDTRAIGPKTVTQHRNRFWTPNSTDDSRRLRMNLSLQPETHLPINYILVPGFCAETPGNSIFLTV